jgi:hypothetical protein
MDSAPEQTVAVEAKEGEVQGDSPSSTHGMYISERLLSCVCKLDVADLLRWPEPTAVSATDLLCENSEDSEPSDDPEDDPMVTQKQKEIEDLVSQRDAMHGHANRKKRQKLNQKIRQAEDELQKVFRAAQEAHAARADKTAVSGAGAAGAEEKHKEKEKKKDGPCPRGKASRKHRPHRNDNDSDSEGEDAKGSGGAHDKHELRRQAERQARDHWRKHGSSKASESDSGSGSGSGTSSRTSSSGGDSSSSSGSGSDESDSEDDQLWEEILFKLSRRYEFLQRLSASRDVAVYCVRDRADGQLVTLKVRAGLPSTQRIPKDVRIHLLLQQYSSHFPKVLDFFRFIDHDCYAIAMPMLDNAPIEKVIFKHPDKERKMRKYMSDLLTAIEHMQRHNILYRDIKSSNVLWNDHEQRATLIDMDTATFFNTHKGHYMYYGTEGYMCTDMDPDERRSYGMEIDLWSAGVVLGQLIYECRENDVTESRKVDAKAEAFVRRAKAAESEGNITAGERLMLRLLDADPKTRIKVQEALQHVFFKPASQAAPTALTASQVEEAQGPLTAPAAPLAAPESTPLAAPESTPLAAPEAPPLAPPEVPESARADAV